VFVLSRIGGEGTDNQMFDNGEGEPGKEWDTYQGNYLALSEEERSVLKGLKDAKDNGTYDKDTTVIITYKTVKDDLSPTAGDYITLEYVYTTDVTAIDGTAHITVEEVTILPAYTPPETTAATEETTEENN
jgi:hypothetical protein